jgi:NAD(P)-dependent dehydrogenase (short-subunit alcohol dehydrogenase family)
MIGHIKSTGAAADHQHRFDFRAGYAGASKCGLRGSKGVIALTKIPPSLGRHNINVNAIARGDANELARATPRRGPPSAASRSLSCRPKPRREFRSAGPMRRRTPLRWRCSASPGARNITGQAYNVDGGLVPS